MNFSIQLSTNAIDVYSLIIAGFRERRANPLLERFRRSFLVLLTGSSCASCENFYAHSGVMPRFTRPISFRPTTTTTICFSLFVITRAGSTVAARRKPVRLWRTPGEKPARRPGAARARFRCEEGEIAERTLVFSLPIVSSRRCLAFPLPARTIVLIRTARSHAGSRMPLLFHCSPMSSR